MQDPTVQRWRQIEELFHRALEQPQSDRSALIAEWCGDDAELRREVESLLEAESAQQLMTPPAADVDHWVGRTLGEFRLGHCIGRGGMGAVYHGERVSGFRQEVAIKIIGTRFSTDWLRERFIVERQVLARLQHPNIARLLDGGVTETGEPYIVMEYVEGQRLDHYCEQHHAGITDVLRLVLQICAAVSYSHANLILHRDLKPGNVLVALDGTVKLLDFGTAKLMDPAEPAVKAPTRMALRAFTPEYASPEQMFGEPVSAASDVYSIGVILYRLLTGKLPFDVQGLSSADLVRTVYDSDPPTPSDAITRVVRTEEIAPVEIRVEDLRGDLDAIVLKALRPAPADRYLTADELARDIENHLAHRPVAAHGGAFSYRAKKFVRRNRIGVAAAALIALTLSGGAIATAYHAHLAAEEAGRAAAGFQDVRRLSNLLLIDLNDQVKQLPGSTEIQQQLVTTGLAYLDRLVGESENNPDLQLDLVRAYTKLGNLQGNPYEQNLGDAQQALITLRKAMPVAAQLESSKPGDAKILRDAAAVRRSYGEVLLSVGQTKDAFIAVESAAATMEKVVELAGGLPDDLSETAGTYDAMGDILGLRGVASFGDSRRAEAAYSKALALHERALAKSPQHRRALRGVVVARMKIANTKQETDPEGAVTEYTHAIEALNALPADFRSSMNVQRLEAMLHVKLGDLLPDIGRPADAIPHLEKACDVYHSLIVLDPQDTRARYDAATCHYHRAMAEKELQRERAARGHYDQVIHLLEEVLRRDKDNAVLKGQLAAALFDAGVLNRGLGAGSEGDVQVRRGLVMAVEVADQLGSSANDLERAASMLVIVTPPAWRDPAKALAFAKRSVEKSEGSRPTSYLTLAKALEATGDVIGARDALEKGKALLAPAHSSSPSPEPRATFESELKRLLKVTARN